MAENVDTNTQTSEVPHVTLDTIVVTATISCADKLKNAATDLATTPIPLTWENTKAFGNGVSAVKDEYAEILGDIKDAASKAAQGGGSFFSAPWNEKLDTIQGLGNSAFDFVESGFKTVGNSVASTAQIGRDVINGTYGLKDAVDLIRDLFSEISGEMACVLADIINEINDLPDNEKAQALGSLVTEIGIQAGLAATTGGAANAAALSLKAARAGKSASKLMGVADDIGAAVSRSIDKLGLPKGSSMRDWIIANKARRVKQSSSPTSDAPRSTSNPQSNQANTEGQVDGDSDSDKKDCPATSCPVNPVQGIKILRGIQDTDFMLTGNLSLIWDRQYSSDSKVGRGRTGDPIGWYGQGWSNDWGMQLSIKPAQDLIELIDPYGRITRFPYMAIGTSFYSRYEDIRLHHDAKGQYRLTSGASEQGDGIQLHFGSPANAEPLTYPHKQRLYCTGKSDHHHNRITLEYHTNNAQTHLPQYIKDSAGRVLQLHFDLIKGSENKGLRLQQITQLIKLTDDKLPALLSALDKKDQQPLQQAHNTSIDAFIHHIQALIDTGKLPKDTLDQHTLVRYQYDKAGDLIEAKPHLTPIRRFDYKNHIMIAHHIDGGISSYYEYDDYLPTGKVLINRISNGQTYHFDYQDGHTIVFEARGTDNERQETYHFNADKRWTGITDGLGNRTTFILDDYHRVEKIISPNGSITKNQYTGDTLIAVKQLIDYNALSRMPEWRTQHYLYDNDNRLTELLDPHGNSTELAYDAAGQIKQITNANGNATHIQRDDKGRISKQILANGSSHSYEYNDKGELIVQTDCSGNHTRYHYDDLGRITQITDAQDQQTTFTYDQRTDSATNSNGIQHTQAPTHIRYPDGSSERFVYDSSGRLLKHTDAKEQATEYQYSDDSLPIKRIDALGHTLEYDYDNLRRLIKLTNENGEKWTFDYDKADNLISETRFDGYTSHYEYDQAGQLVHQIDNPQAKREEQKHTYLQRDLLGQLTHKHSLDSVNKNSKSAQRHHKTQYQYDIAGQLIRATSPDVSTHLDYDNIGQLITERLTRHHKNHNGTQASNQNSAIEQTLTHRYDEIGNRIATILPDGKVINQLYYGSGHLYNQSITDNEGSITEIRHSERNALHLETTRQQGELLSSFGYDAMGRLTTQHSTRYSAKHGAKYSTTESHITIVRHYNYDVLGQLTHLSGQTQLNSQTNSTASSLFQRNHQYDYDKVGRLTQHKLTDYTKQSGTTERFAFDPASNRVPVSTATNEDKEQNNNIHKSGRPTKLITADKYITYTYGIHGQVLYKTIAPVKDGKPIAQSTNSLVSSRKSIQHYYNPNNELVKTITNTEEGFTLEEITTTYYYDAFGRRIAKASDTKVKTKFINDKHLKTLKYHIQKQKTQHKQIHYLWDGNRQAQEYTDTHVFTTIYEQNSFEPVARLVWLKDELLQAANDDIKSAPRESWEPEPKPIPNMQVYHYHNDHLGTPNELTNQQGEVVWLADYEAYGNVARVVWREEKLEQLQVAKEHLQPLRFQGQYYDEETGLHYNRFRYFDPDLGMFISRDPIGLAGGVNNFEYVKNPTIWIDPFGLSSRILDRNLGGVVGDKMQAHHLIPEQIWKRHLQFFEDIGMGDEMDNANNGVLAPCSESKAKSMNRAFYHCGSHAIYSAQIEARIAEIENDFKDKAIDASTARAKIAEIQTTSRRLLSMPGLSPRRIR